MHFVGHYIEDLSSLEPFCNSPHTSHVSNIYFYSSATPPAPLPQPPSRTPGTACRLPGMDVWWAELGGVLNTIASLPSKQPDTSLNF